MTFQMDGSTVTHYWYGPVIPETELPGGVTCAFSNAIVETQFEDDPNLKSGGHSGGYTTAFSITGQGLLVDFQVSSQFGNLVYLYTADTDTAARWVVAGSTGANTSAFDEGDPGYSPPTCALRVLLEQGRLYVLEIGSSGYFPPPGPGYKQNFTLTVGYPGPNNDRRNDAFDVVIPTDGATYTSPLVLNTGYGPNPRS